MNSNKKDHLQLLTVLFACFLIISNIAAVKIVEIAGFIFPAGLIFFPITFIFDDVITEVYGFKASRRIIWLAFLANSLVMISLYAVTQLPSSTYFADQSAFEAIFTVTPRILLASLVSYLVGEFANSYVLAKLKIATNGKLFGLRAIASTALGVGLDTILFCTIAFYGLMPSEVILSLISFQYFIKVSYEILVLPLTYKVVAYLKKSDNVDYFDKDTNFSPFKL
ncbi:MAG: queuosine precursor transporter [Rickettsiales bacterium]